MRQFDVYRMPNASQRAERPFVLVLQHDRLDSTRTVVVAPLSRPQFTARGRAAPRLIVADAAFALITHELGAIDRRLLPGEPIDNLQSERIAIMNALDAVFSAAG